MASIRKFLAKDPLASADAELRRREGLERFLGYLPSGVDDIWPRALSRFVHSVPWRYWDTEVVESSLKILESSVERTVCAISAWSRQIGIGFDNLFRRAPTSDYEENLTETRARDLLCLSTEFHPEYLRCAQHIFANLITVYWAVLKKGSVQGNFKLRNAISLIESKGHNFLLSGYDDRVRNAIAHGEVAFRGVGIQYGPQIANYELCSLDFLAKFDSLWRTSNALSIALLLFIVRNKYQLATIQNLTLPPSIIAFLAAAAVERSGLTVMGTVESDFPRTGKQLHIAVQTTFRSREVVLLDSARLAMHLLENGALGYSRYLFEIDYGKAVSSLVVILSERLAKLLEEETSVDRLGEIFQETQLLWYDESKLSRQLRTWKLLFASHVRLAREDVRSKWQSAGLWRGAGRYRTRKVENMRAGNVLRARVTAVLRYPSDADDKEMIKEITHAIIREVSKRWINPNLGGFERKWGWLGRPKYVWLSLYKVDGTLRWLGAGGWARGNLVAVAEKIYGSRRPPIFVPKPEQIWKGIRFRYTMDMQAAAEAMGKLIEVVDEMRYDVQERNYEVEP